MNPFTIKRLAPNQAAQIVACFRKVYGATYANDLFYDPVKLAEQMKAGRLGNVGAVLPDGRIVGHMAMSVYPGATSVELGNTVVDPEARGAGVAWKVGAELVSWSRELGYPGFLHYPTTDHHIMQRQSVTGGFETGLMLGYIPAETDGKVNEGQANLRQAATIVYQPLDVAVVAQQRLPEYCAERIVSWGSAIGVERDWKASKGRPRGSATEHAVSFNARRSLARLTITQVGDDIRECLGRFDAAPEACMQIDFSMADEGIEAGVVAARDAGYWFCGWLPGFGDADVYRMQRVDEPATDMAPNVVNPVAKSLLNLVPQSR